MSKGGRNSKTETASQAPSADAAPIPGFGGIAEGEAVASIALDGGTVVIPAADPAPSVDVLHPELAPLVAERNRVHFAHAKVQSLAAEVQAMEAALESLVRDQKAVINAKTQELREAIDARQKLRAVSQVEEDLAAKRKKLGL